MAFLTGPRQCGKTTLAKTISDRYFTWDDLATRRLVAGDAAGLAAAAGLGVANVRRPVITLDEIHKFPRWKTFIKGFFDIYEDRMRLIVTGSARLDIYKRGGDSLMGRYFLYHMHPFGVAELVRTELEIQETHTPRPIEDADWDALWEHGGFPEPFVRRDRRFTLRWRKLRREQLFREDLRDLTKIADIAGIRILSELLLSRAGNQIVTASLAREIGVAETTVKAWKATLEYFHEGFSVRPWFRNIENSIRKTPKWYQCDWCEVADEGARFENLVACHLSKSVDAWNDLGLGDFALYYIRNKAKEEVDFLVAKDGRPWFLAEAKISDATPSRALAVMQKRTGAAHAFQIVRDLPYTEVDAFSFHVPVAVSARSFLSQLF
ncbi:MAG: ATP-binding protein [Kiritimatiellae bacterium]|nr:ATP-binding protein [Kiritimatiellia bacterium]